MPSSAVLQDRVALVTGGATGLGRVYALRLAAEGADVCAADVSVAGVKETARLVEEKGRKGLGVEMDVTTEEQTVWEAREQRLDREIERQRRRIEAAEDDAARGRFEQKIAALEEQRQAEPRIRALWSRGVPSPTYLLQRGDYRRPGQVVQPGAPSVLDTEGTTYVVTSPRDDGSATGRRLALAR